MKILITDIHHGNGGGHVTYVLSLLKGLRSRHDVTVLVPPTGRLHAAAAQTGVRTLPGLYTSRPFPLLAEVRKLRKFLRQERFDIIHVNGGADHRHVMLATLGMQSRPAIVWTKHNTNPVSSFGHRLRARFGTHACIAVCDYVAALLDRSDYRHQSVRVVRLGIDDHYFQPVGPDQRNAFRQQLFGPLADDVLVLGSTGGTDYAKGWLDLVKAASHLDARLRARVRIVVAGAPPSDTMLAKVASFGMLDQVVFPGLISDVRTVLGASDAGFVLSYQEAASYACCEAMSMGLPVLVSNVGGLPENVRDGQDGWVVPPGNIDAIVGVLHQMLAHPQRLQDVGHTARNRIQQVFSEAAFFEDTQAVYQQAHRLVRNSAAPI
ncbi:glycosyltransferase family 4 protein [Pusillimonas sp. MFBS29]|uniref:glycosyltransferase family 4 protein n=1 Tax=Pusillimonas sp. MFBS29 TaxID=2886690 RepID=UPI001D107DDC|nr:glycosyltransferase family 4 protein [Pusillimonas sp. MFBS29]MCC2596389.1 glycosyltransferase family 4 protein [Pusillimonas sp. MFBS29]